MATDRQIRQNIADVHTAWGALQNLFSGIFSAFIGGIQNATNRLPVKRSF